MSENQTAAFDKGRRTGLDWFVRCVLIGLVIGLGVNAVSYFFLSDGIVDLIGSDQKIAEAIGFPKIFWHDAVLPLGPGGTSVSFEYPGKGSIDYSALGWNLMFGLIAGGIIGWFAVHNRRRLNASAEHQRQRYLKSRQSAGYFQITMLGILAITTVVAATIAVGNQFGSIPRKPVESTNVASIGYNSITKTLEVEFHTGSVYQYFQVPTNTYREFESADSLGRYLSKNIRNKFSFQKTNDKKTSKILLAILMLGPLYLLTFAILLNRYRRKTRITLAAMLGAVLICVGMSSSIRTDMNPDRVLMGLFVFWMPQIALFVVLRTIVFSTQTLMLRE